MERVAVLKYYKTVNIVDKKVHEQEQIKRAYEIGLGKMKIDEIELKAIDIVGDEKFENLIEFINQELK